MNKKQIIRKALAEAHVTELEAFVLVQQIFEEQKNVTNEIVNAT